MPVSPEQLAKYEMTIGIECHVQLKTKTKLFSSVDNDSRTAAPNTNISPICFGMPGVLPVLNAEAINLAIRAGLALNAEVAHFSKFDRKHYFYPDLPKGYQITQFDQPTVGKGWVEILVNGEKQRIGVTRAHLEEDAGKLQHPEGKEYSLVDLNRAGTPLLEIVSEPDIHSPVAARAYAQELYYLMKYADVSDVDLYHGNMRFDVNLSVALRGSSELGTRSETKNLNSFRSVEKAAEFEFRRQVEALEKGEAIVQETRGWDDIKFRTFSQRSKEDAHDYRYFPEPDIPPVIIDEHMIEKIRSELPRLPAQIREELQELKIDGAAIEALLSHDGELTQKYTDVILETKASHGVEAAAFAAKFIVNDLFAQSESLKEGVYLPTPKQFTGVHELIAQQKLSSTNAKELLLNHLGNLEADVVSIAEHAGLLQVSDESSIAKVVDAVIQANPQAVEDVKRGEAKAIGFLIGQVMKESKGQANPQMAQKLIRERLG